MNDFDALQRIADIVMMKAPDSERLILIVGVLIATGDLKPKG